MAARPSLALSPLLLVLLSSTSLASAASSASASASAAAGAPAALAPAAFLFSECLPRFGYRAGALDCGTCAIIARALREGGPSSSSSSSSSSAASSAAAAAAAVAAEEAACRACCSPTVGLRSSRRFARARIDLPPRSALSMFMRAQGGGGGDANDNPLGAPPGVKEWLEKAMHRWEGQVEVANAAAGAGAGGAPDLASMMAGGLGGMGGPKGETTLTLLTDEEAEGVVAAGASASDAAGSDSVVTITSWKWEVIEAFLNKKLLRRDD